MSAAFSLKHGNNFPYDAPDAWWQASTMEPPPAKDWAHRAARGIVANLTDRRDLKHGFQKVDEKVRSEIVETIADIIRLATKPYRIIGPDALDQVTVERCAAHLTDVAAAMWERTETHRGDEPFSNPTNAEREDATTAYCLDKAAEAIRALCKEEAGK